MHFDENANRQNLVYNYSFEDTVTCQQWLSNPWPKLPCKGWYQSLPNPDYFSLTYTQFCGISSFPNNFLGYQLPKTGVACTGFATTYLPLVHDYKEGITGYLIDTLKKNHLYEVSLYVNSCNNCQLRTGGIDVYFSLDSLNTDSFYLFNISPQLSSPKGTIYYDTLGWEKITWYYTALGGEKWMTIGGMTRDSLIDIDSVSGWTQFGGYYYLDDISVIDCTASSINEVAALAFQLLNNAATHTLTVTSGGISEFSILALDGKKVLSQYFHKSESKIEIDIGTLARGMYVLQVMDKRKRIGYKKFVRL